MNKPASVPLPPFDDDTERAVLGAILQGESPAVNGQVLDGSYFYSEKHQRIANALHDLHVKGDPLDFLNLMKYLREIGHYRKEELYYITGLPQYAELSANFVNAVEMLKDLAERRRLREQVLQLSTADFSRVPLSEFEELEHLPFPHPHPGQYPQTDSGNAEYFAHLYNGRARYNHRYKIWLIFKNHWWQPDQDGEIKRLVKVAARQRFRAACGIQDPKQRLTEARFAIQSESRQKIESTLSLVQSEKPIADSGKGWDSDPLLLGVANGVLNLGTGELRDGKPEDRISKQTCIPYDPKANRPNLRWRLFLKEIFNGDRELIDFIWRAVGYSLTGDTSEQVLFLCHGSGSNGKTVFLNVIRHIAGDYGYNTGFTTLELHRDSTSSHDVANLKGNRLVTASETSEFRRLNEARIKALTGGDAVTARHLYKSEFTFRPCAKLWLATNHLPVIQDDSPGFWRRIIAIPFTQQFTEPKADPQLEQILKDESDGILAWAIDGCMAWQEKGLKPPEIVRVATQKYREESDPLSDFLTDACIIRPEYETSASDLYAAYRQWCEDQGMKKHEVLSQTALGRRMGERFQRRSTGRVRLYTSIGLRNAI